MFLFFLSLHEQNELTQTGVLDLLLSVQSFENLLEDFFEALFSYLKGVHNPALKYSSEMILDMLKGVQTHTS